jgi:signal transduction protein with GAF and PtsI domain
MFEKSLEYYSVTFKKKHIWELLELPKSTFYKLIKKNGLKLEHYKIICRALNIPLTDEKSIILKKVVEISYE